jgi:hypothetical protein
MANIFETLKIKGLGIGTVQNVDEMTVIPLVGDDRGDVASPSSLRFQRTTTYGSMQFKNDDERPAIVPSNYMVRGQGAQDHAMASSGIVNAKSVKTFENACCIEETQGGYLSSQNNEEDVLPIELRRELLDLTKRRQRSYGKLWTDIKEWLRGLSLQRRSGSAHLRYFYDDRDVKSALEAFAAEFEPVEGQIGAIIMFSGIPVGIEIMPSSAHWEAYWQQLLRGCYGSELLRMKMLGKISQSTLILPDIPSEANPEEVKNILETFMEHINQEVLPVIQNIQITSNQRTSTDGNLQSRLIRTDGGGGGDVIVQGSTPIYISIVL